MDDEDGRFTNFHAWHKSLGKWMRRLVLVAVEYEPPLGFAQWDGGIGLIEKRLYRRFAKNRK